MVDALFLETPKDNRKKALAVDPAKGKTEKKLYFSPHCGDETTTYYNRALLVIPLKLQEGISHFLWRSFRFPVGGFHDQGISWLSLGSLEDASTGCQNSLFR